MKPVWRICLLSLVLVESAFSQNVIPMRIVGMEYPRLAIAAGVKGDLKIGCTVSPGGKVLSAEILEASSRPVREILGKAAQDTMLQWIFAATDNQSERSVLVTFKFDLIAKKDPAMGSKFVFDSPGAVSVTAEISNQIVP